jgi:hypothetical protein
MRALCAVVLICVCQLLRDKLCYESAVHYGADLCAPNYFVAGCYAMRALCTMVLTCVCQLIRGKVLCYALCAMLLQSNDDCKLKRHVLLLRNEACVKWIDVTGCLNNLHMLIWHS